VQPPPPASPSPPLAPPSPAPPGYAFVVDASFGVDEAYFSGQHNPSAQDTAELTGVVETALAAGGVHVYAIGMTHAHSSGQAFVDEVVHWTVDVVVLASHVASLEAWLADDVFESFLDASHLMGDHLDSMLSLSGPLVVAPTPPRIQAAPSPPTSAP